VALGDGVFLSVLLSSFVIIIPPMIRTHSSPTPFNLSNWQRRQVTHLEQIMGLVR
jgi:hypothetical protein